MRPGRFHVNEAGTRYVMNPVKKPPPRQKQELPNDRLAPFMGKGEANGDWHLAVLMATRNLLASASCWHGRGQARTRTNQPCEPTSPDAVSWSIIGAIAFLTFPQSSRSQRTEVIAVIRAQLSKEAAEFGLWRWEEQPTTRHSQVLHVLNMAISARKKALGYV